MPHKRAKKTIREQIRKEKGSELAPGKASLKNEAIPKSVTRVLNAQAIRHEWKLKKKRKCEDGGDDAPRGKRPRMTTAESGSGNKATSRRHPKATCLAIQPGESIQHFNKRVENDLRPLVKSAIQASLAVRRHKAKADKQVPASEVKRANSKTRLSTDKVQETSREISPPPPRIDQHADRAKEFQLASSSSVPRRLNDIAKAPPDFKNKKFFSRCASSSTADGVLSMSQQLMMDQERMRAIVRYRELKADRKQPVGGPHIMNPSP